MPCQCDGTAPTLEITKQAPDGGLLEKRVLCTRCDADAIARLAAEAGTETTEK